MTGVDWLIDIMTILAYLAILMFIAVSITICVVFLGNGLIGFVEGIMDALRDWLGG
jgi:hypothetical protein